jgi:hypothetical protein
MFSTIIPDIFSTTICYQLCPDDLASLCNDTCNRLEKFISELNNIFRNNIFYFLIIFVIANERYI